MNVEKILLHRLQVGSIRYVTNAANYSVTYDDVRRALRHDVRSHVLSHRLAEYDVTYEVPANWWQHLRQQIGLSARTTTRLVHVDRYRTYPDADIVLPEPRFGEPVMVEVLT